MIELNLCPYCKGIAKVHIKTVESFRKIHNYYVECTDCGTSTERYNTEFAYYLDGKRFSPMTKREAISKAVYDWNNGIFDIQTRLLHMTEQEKIMWYTTDLLGVAWYGANVLVGSLRWETAWKLRKIAEDQKLLKFNSDKSYDLSEVAYCLINAEQVKDLVITYMESLQCNTL